MDTLYMLDAFFRVLRPIRSLPLHHGARWSAWLRFACKDAGLVLDDLAAGMFPLRGGNLPFHAGEFAVLRLLARPEGLAHFPRLAQALRNTQARGEFSPETLDLFFLRDAIGGKAFPPDEAPNALAPLAAQCVEGEINALMANHKWRMRFLSPLRLKAGRGGKGREQFCDAEFFSDQAALPHLLAHVRGLEKRDSPLAQGITVIDARVSWEDMRYSAQRQIALGGVMGEICFKGAPDRDTAEALVLGQYLGAGKNALFGLGHWLIPELNAVRKIPLTDRDIRLED